MVESRHVFIQAGLMHRGRVGEPLDILEIGFGTGLNALLTLAVAQQEGFIINYTAVEAYPIEVEVARSLEYPKMVGLAGEEHFFEQMHACASGETLRNGQFSFEKRIAKFEEIEDVERFDLIYYDAFGPAAQPELWASPMPEKMYAALRPGGVLVTYCAQGAFRRAMRDQGFLMERLPGPPGKREMLRGNKL